MTETDVVQHTPFVHTRASLARDLARLGVQPGMTLIVHSSLSELGWVTGGPVAVIQALMDALGPQGTLVMPAHCGEYSDPAKWGNPPVPQDWWPVIRAEMPAYEPQITPTRSMGAIAEAFRTFPGVLRSAHPALSFTAWGCHAVEVTRGHQLEESLGEGSPLARIYDLDGWILLLGVGYDRNTSMHLAEYRSHLRTATLEGAPMLIDGVRTWQTYADILLDADRFSAIGAAFEWNRPVILGEVGAAQARLIPQRECVDYAVRWLNEHPV